MLNFMKIRLVGNELFHTDRRTEENYEANSRLFAILGTRLKMQPQMHLNILYELYYIYVGFRTFFHVVRYLKSTASYLPTGLHVGFFRSWPSLFLPSRFSSVLLEVSPP